MMQKIEKGSSRWGGRGLTRENWEIELCGTKQRRNLRFGHFKQNFDSHRNQESTECCQLQAKHNPAWLTISI
jgi:hypothetical protein